MQSTVPTMYLPSIVFNSRHIVHTTRKSTKQRHQHKLEALSAEQDRPLFDVHDTVRVHNLDVVPPRYVLDTLALGPRNPTLDQFNKNTVLAELDLLLEKCSKVNVPHDTVNDINIAVVRYIKQCEKQHIPRNLKLTQTFLKKHECLAIPFDKGTGFCLMKAEEYEKKILDILSLPQFQKMETKRKNAKDPTVKEQDRIKEELERLRDEGKWMRSCARN